MSSYTVLLFLALSLWVRVAHQSGFTSPDYMAAYGHGAFQSNVVWHIGQDREVVYDISDIDGMDNYTVALWQQSIIGGGATLGPVVNSKCSLMFLYITCLRSRRSLRCHPMGYENDGFGLR